MTPFITRVFAKNRATPEIKTLISLAAPVLLSQLLQTLMVVIDTIMSGHYSATDLSAVAIGGSIWFPIYVIAIGVISALTPVVAHLHGAKQSQEIVKNTYQSLYIAILLCPLLISTVFFIEPLLRFINADPDVQPIAVAYLKALFLGFPPLVLFTVLRSYSDGVSITKPAVITSLIALIINVPLNYALIYGKFGLPELGGEGCGWATAVSLYVMFFTMAFIVRKKEYRAFSLFDKFYAWHWPSVRHLLVIGAPIGLTYFVEASMFGVVALFLASLGPIVVAAHQIALSVATTTFMIPMSLSIALTIRVGFLLGSQERKRAIFTIKLGLALAIFYACFSAITLFLLRNVIPKLYTNEADVILLCGVLLTYAAIFQLADSIQVSCAGALRGFKDTRSPLIIMTLTFWCFGLPLGYTLGLTDYLGPAQHAAGFWLGLVAGLFTASVLLAIRLRFVTQKT